MTPTLAARETVLRALEPEDLPPILDLAESARLARFSVQTMRRLCREGRIPGAFPGPSGRWRIPRESLIDFLAGVEPEMRS